MTEFLGYRRDDGSVGIRNHVVVLSAMDTANPTAQRIASSVRGAVPITISFGRGQIGFDYEMTVRALAGLGANPNVAAVLVVSLEPTSAERVAAPIAATGKPVEIITLMGEGGSINATARGVRWVAEQTFAASRKRREPCPVSSLIVGVECGGSDTTSGLASNPAVGAMADLLVDAGGSVILSETSEWMGGEHLLAERTADSDVAKRIIEAVERVEQDAHERGVDIRGQQPTADNIRGGLTTIEEKSLGAILKGGTRPVADFLEYCERPRKPGLNLMDTAAPAAESITALSAGGCQMILFSTGQCNQLGAPLSPTLKVSGNATTLSRMTDHIDIDVGNLLSGETSLQETGARVMRAAMEVASGGLTRAEIFSEEVTTISRFERSL
ncbi:UxaA family hydrolase [Pikeienuella piscinae]|uniref:UxaA family hydrolase n=1 Tax=Pikeienuella piscinae TaxID=2748098 RepID=A0A7L5BZD8_9RHOB|nr:UxaA family hydrolase [Pikeienuella piscinae]QIE56198.1 UxaA family hydrolase [Pikeienuella piscinae]